MGRRKGALFIVLVSIVCMGLVLAAGTKDSPFGSQKINNENDLSEFLLTLGYECDLSMVTVQSSVLPAQFDETFIAYNAIQLQQDCDLSRYAGKEVTVYTVPITNYTDSDESVLASVIVYRGKVIGGDIHAAAMDGFILPLK